MAGPRTLFDKIWDQHLVDVQEDGTRIVVFQVNGEAWYMPVTDHSSETERNVREKATEPGHVGSPMSGVIVGLKIKAGKLGLRLLLGRARKHPVS